jgi:hypothetical protein
LSPTKTLWLTGVVELGAGADVDEAVAAVDDGTAEEVATVAVALVEFPVAFAAAWNAASWPGPGLMANTIPAAQCELGTFCLQYIQIGARLWIVTVAAGKGPDVSLAETGRKPESNPPASGVHGSFKLDWVIVWFFCWKVNVTVSPTAADYRTTSENHWEIEIDKYIRLKVGCTQ